MIILIKIKRLSNLDSLFILEKNNKIILDQHT